MNGQRKVSDLVRPKVRQAVCRALISSAVLIPACFFAPGVFAQTPNQQSTAENLGDLCDRLAVLAGQDGEGGPGTITTAQRDVLSRCSGIFGGEGSSEEVAQILSQVGAEDFNALRTLSVVFAESQFQTVMDRLLALRAGTHGGVSVAGLNLRMGDQNISGEQVAESLRPFLGGGASGDGPEPGGLLDNRLGLWMRGNYGKGEKDASVADAGFESDQWGVTAGADYRFGQSIVAGAAVGYGKADLDFSPEGRGGIATKSFAVSVYGSAYVDNIYLDAVVNYVGADYDSSRHVNYTEDFGATIDQTFRGSSDGDTLSAAVAVGYDFVVGGFTLAPSIGYNYVDVAIDAFTEAQGDPTQAGFGLNLAFNDQDYKSRTGNIGLRASYAWKMSWGVLVPHFRSFYVREFEDGIAAFDVRFASDPFSGASNPTPPIVVQSDQIDESYLRLAVGASAQFKHDVSGYFEYQRLEGYENVEFHDFTVGLRFQHSF
jgi:outer membrane autotransporter protein